MSKTSTKLLAVLITITIMFLTTKIIGISSISELSTLGAVFFALELIATYFIITLILKKTLTKD